MMYELPQLEEEMRVFCPNINLKEEEYNHLEGNLTNNIIAYPVKKSI